MKWLIAIFPSIVLQDLIAFGAVCGPLWLWRRRALWAPDWKREKLAPSQKFDGIILGCVCIPVMLALTTRADSSGFVYSGGGAVVVTASCLCFFCILCSKSVTTPFVWLIVILSFSFGDWVREEVHANRRVAIESKPTEDFRVSFSTSVDIPNPTLWINGQEVGNLPLEMNAAELVQTLPSGAEFKKSNRYPGQRLLQNLDRGYSFGWRERDHRFASWMFTLIRYGGRNEKRRFEGYVQIRTNGVPTWASNSSNYSINNRHVFHDVRIREWEDNLTKLAHFARLHNYHVGNDWYEAVCSYGTRGWAFFFELASAEQELNDLCDEIASRLYSLQNLTTHEAAIDTLERIRALPEPTFGSESLLRARALELTALRLDPKKLIPYLMDNIEAVTYELPLYSYWWTPGPVTPNAPLGYVVWFLDKLQDSQSSHSAPNLFEQKITPEAIKRGYHNGAFRLGGPAAEELMRRKFRQAKRNWKKDPTKHATSEYRRALIQLAMSDSELADWARDSHEIDFMSWLEEALRKIDDPKSPEGFIFQSSEPPEFLKPLFRSSAGKKASGSLARKSWLMMLAATEKLNDPDRCWEIRSNWLLWMYPHSRPEMFADAWMKTSLRSNRPSLHKLSHSSRNSPLQPQFRFEVLDRIRKLREAELENFNLSVSERQKREAEVNNVMRMMATLPCRGGAEAFVEKQDALKEPYHIKMLRDRMSVNLYHDDHVEVLAEHPNVEYRSGALLAIRYHPTPRRRNVLEVLMEDSNDRIQQEARELQAEFERLRTSRLSHRRPPTLHTVDTTNGTANE